MVPRVKGMMEFRTASARTTFLTTLSPLRDGRESYVDKRAIPPGITVGSNAVYLDLALKDPAQTEAVFNAIRVSANIRRAYVHIHLCGIDGVAGAARDFRKFEVP